MQSANKKPRSILGRGIGACVPTITRKKTEMNTSMRRKAPATKAKLSAVTIDQLNLTQAEVRLIFASRKVDEYSVWFYTNAIEQYAARHPITSQPALRLVQGGAA